MIFNIFYNHDFSNPCKQKSTVFCIVVMIVVVVMTRPSGVAYMEGQKCPEEMRKSTRL